MTSHLIIPINIPDVDVLRTEITSENQLMIYVESTLETATCGICGQEIRCTYGHGEDLKLRHLPVLGMDTYVVIRPRRGQCKQCWNEPTTTQLVTWYQQRSPHTEVYEQYLLKQLINSTTEDVSMKEQVGYDAIVGALNRQVDTEINWDAIKDLHTVGIDEIAMKKGKKDYVAIMTAKQHSGKVCVLAVLPDRKKKTVKAFLEQIPVRLHTSIQYFTTDMWDGYIYAVEEFIAEQKEVEAALVIDRFHVAQQYREDFDELRKEELKRLKKELPQETYDRDCKHTLWLLRKNHAALKDEERKRLRRLFQHSPELQRAYTLREELTAIFNLSQTPEEAERRLHSWIRKAQSNGLSCYDSFINTLTRQWQRILNYFHARINSGFVEGLNNKIKVIKRRCYGIKKTTTLFQRLWLDLEGAQHFFVSTP